MSTEDTALICRVQGPPAVLGTEAQRMSVSYGRTTQNSFPSGSTRTVQGLSAGLPDVDPARPEREKAINLLVAVRGAAGEVEMHAVLDRLGLGDRLAAHAGERVCAGPDDALVHWLGKNLPSHR